MPVQATGALAGKALTQITAGWLYGCALDTAGAAYCWGTGALGGTENSRVPLAVELWTCTGGANQKWQARHGALVNLVSGKCLNDPRYDTADGTQLEIYTCNGGANQRWELPGAAAGPARPRAGRRG